MKVLKGVLLCEFTHLGRCASQRTKRARVGFLKHSTPAEFCQHLAQPNAIPKELLSVQYSYRAIQTPAPFTSFRSDVLSQLHFQTRGSVYSVALELLSVFLPVPHHFTPKYHQTLLICTFSLCLLTSRSTDRAGAVYLLKLHHLSHDHSGCR